MKIYQIVLTEQEIRRNAEGFVCWWKCDEGAGTIVNNFFSFNDNQGVIQGEATWVDGVRGNALQYNGTNAYVAVKPTEELRGETQEISIEAWIYPTPLHQQYYGGIINNINGASNSRLLVNDDGTLLAQISGTNVFGPAVTNNTWNHVVYVYNGEEEVWYLNGVKGTPFLLMDR